MMDSLCKLNKRIIISILFFSCISTYFTCNFNMAYGFTENVITNSGNLSNNDISMLGGAFAPLVGIGGSPFIVLTILSGVGTLLNSGSINPNDIPLSDMFMQLPISNTNVFITLLIITLIKLLLSLLSASKILCDATFGKLENLTGIICSVGGAYLITSASTVYAVEATTTTIGNTGIGVYILTNIISFMIAVLAYAIYIVIKTMIAAIDILAFLFSPIPGTTGIFVILKHLIIGLYTWLTIVNPFISTIIGVFLVIIACLVFRTAKRLELYYRRIYLIPFTNAIFRNRHRIPLIPKKLPYGVAIEFNDIDFCIECFFMNKTSEFHKRERCYFIRSNEKNYLYKKRFFGKTIKMELSGDIYIEKPFIFKFLKIFTDEALHISRRRIYLVIRREHGWDIAYIITKAMLIDYNMVLEERKRKKMGEFSLKAQQMKVQALNNLISAKKIIKIAFDGLLSRNKKK